MITSLAFIAGGAVIVVVGRYFWGHPDQYYRYLHGTTVWAALSARPPEAFVKFGAALAVVIGIGVTGWGIAGIVA